MEFIKPFWDEYGYSLIVLVAYGIFIAAFIEIAAKKVFSSMIENAEGVKKEKLVRTKAVTSSICGAVISVFGAFAVIKGMPLPGGIYCYGLWYLIVYVVQYLTSMYAIKFILKKIKNKDTEKPVKTQKPKQKTYKVDENIPVFKRLEDGTFTEI